MERQHLRDGGPKLPYLPPFGVLDERLACIGCGIETWHAINWDSKRTPDNHISKQHRGLGAVHKGYIKIDRNLTLYVAAVLYQHTYHRHAEVPWLAQETAAIRTLACSRLGNESTDGGSSRHILIRSDTAVRKCHIEVTASWGMPQN
jgi:hypothetical protein